MGKEKSFEPERAPAPAVDPVAIIGAALDKIVALLDERLPAAGGLLGGMPDMEDPRLFTVQVFPTGFMTCDDQYGREVWPLCGKYSDLRAAVLAAAKAHDDVRWYRSDGDGRLHEADQAYFEAGNFAP